MSIRSWLINSCLSLVIFSTALFVSWTPVSALQDQVNDANEKRIQFTAFYKVEWRSIIEFYAEEAQLSLQIQDPPPTGTFDYQSDRSMSLREGLDFLNQMLIQNDRVLIRNEDLLLMYDVTKGIPKDMIQTVSPEQLEQRGKYEVLNCNFDITGLEGEDLRNQLQSFVTDHYERNMMVIPAANVLIVQEVGHKLRFINEQVIKPAVKSRGRNDWDVQQIELTHVAPEDILAHAAAIGIRRDTMSNEDGSLTLSISPFENRILASGDPDQISRFSRVVEAIDVPLGDDNLTPREPPFFQRYTVIGEAEKIHQVLQTVLAGSPEARLDFDAESNQVYLWGRDEDHEKALDVINKSEGSSDELAVLWIKEADAEDVIETVEKLFRQTDAEDPEGPVLTPESQNRVIVRGKPSDVAMVRKMVEQIDIPYASNPSNSTNRFISLGGSELNRSLNVLENMIPTMGLNNEIQVVQPDERNLFYDHDRSIFKIMGAPTNSPTLEQNPAQQNPPIRDTNSPPGTERQDERSDQSSNLPSPRFMLAALFSPNTLISGTVGWQQETGNGTGQSSEEVDSPFDRPVDQEDIVPSVPGAPITIRVTEYGIGLESDDTMALDKLEELIRQNLDATAGSPQFVIFLLKHLDAMEAKQQLESYLGLSSGGGGGGGALSGLMGGFVNNALGGGAGDMMSGLLGGGSSSSSDTGVVETDGPVAIVANVKNYSLAISALPSDMEKIRQLIEFMDQSEAMHDPNPVGMTRIIEIRYQDVKVVEEMVKQNLSIMLKSAEQANGGGNDPGAAAQRQVLQAILGGRGGRGGGAGGGGDDAEAPKASMVVDERNSTLVVTGPKFVYDQILFLVRMVDVPRSGPPLQPLLVQRGPIPPDQLLDMLLLLYPDNIEIIRDEDGTGPATATPGAINGRANNGRAATGGVPGIDANALQQIMLARQRGQGQGRGAQGQGGQGTRNVPGGGGNRGGGGGNGPGGGNNRDGGG